MFDYSTQATTYLILIVITSLINLICYAYISGVWGFVGYLLYTLITVPFVILWMYNIDCLTSGDCQIWSWVITSLTLISVLTTTILLVAFAVNPSLSSSTTASTAATTTTSSLNIIPPTTATTAVITPAATTAIVTPTAATATPATAAK